MQKLVNVLWYTFLDSIRDYMAIILTLILPLMLLVLVNFNITATPQVSFRANFKLPSWVKTSENPDAVLTLKDEKLIVDVKTEDPTKISVIKAIVWKIVSKMKNIKPFYRVEFVKLSSYSGKSYLLAGMIALAILSSGMVVAARVLSRYMEGKLTKFINATPVKKQFYTSIVLNSILITLLAAFIMLALARYLGIPYEFSLYGAVLIIAAGLLSTSFGILIAVLIPSRTGAAAVASLVYTLLPPFSGMYFPVELLPKYLQIFSYYLPSTWIFLLVKSALKI